MRQLKHGRLLFLALALLLNGCRSDQPPPKEICILDGFGGGDCVESDGSKLYRAPSAMLNYWATNETDEQNFAAWCYDTTPAAVAPVMQQLKAQALP
jgi:hypothetical protein